MLQGVCAGAREVSPIAGFLFEWSWRFVLWNHAVQTLFPVWAMLDRLITFNAKVLGASPCELLDHFFGREECSDRG